MDKKTKNVFFDIEMLRRRLIRPYFIELGLTVGQGQPRILKELREHGIMKQEKTTDIWFDEKDPLIHIRTHNTDLKKRLLAYSRRYPAICQQMDADPETGCMEFDIAKGRFSFRLTAPYSEERREATRRYARENSTTNLLK